MSERKGTGVGQRLLTTTDRLHLSGVAARFTMAAQLLEDMAALPTYTENQAVEQVGQVSELEKALTNDLDGLRRMVDRVTAPREVASKFPEDDCGEGSLCQHEPLDGLRYCFTHLWTKSQRHRPGYRFLPDSPEPSEAVVPRGVSLIGENGIRWERSGDRWRAVNGDGGLYPWGSLNWRSSAEGAGHRLVRLIPEYAR